MSELDTCAIYLMGFGPDHVPVRFTAQDAWNHIFSKSCLKAWLLSANEDANVCPTRLCQLYRTDDNGLGFNKLDDSTTEGAGGTESDEDDSKEEPAKWSAHVPGRQLSKITEPRHALALTLQFTRRLDDSLTTEIGCYLDADAVSDDRLLMLSK